MFSSFICAAPLLPSLAFAISSISQRWYEWNGADRNDNTNEQIDEWAFRSFACLTHRPNFQFPPIQVFTPIFNYEMKGDGGTKGWRIEWMRERINARIFNCFIRVVILPVVALLLFESKWNGIGWHGMKTKIEGKCKWIWMQLWMIWNHWGKRVAKNWLKAARSVCSLLRLTRPVPPPSS